MAMNSQGNQPPQIPADSESLNRRFDEQRLTPNIDATINPTDVLCGRGKSSFTHVGNRRFRDAITNAIDEYNGSESRLAKSRVVQRIVENIKREGGRFLKRDRVNGGWVELDTKSCRDKVGHAIRDAANLIEQRKQKQQRRKDAFAQLEQRGGVSSIASTSLREERNLSISTSLREESKLNFSSPPSWREESKFSSSSPWAGIFEESKLRDDDDDLVFETSSQKGKLDDLEEDACPSKDDDSFIGYINDVLGPLSAQELKFDPLVEYNTDDEVKSSTRRR